MAQPCLQLTLGFVGVDFALLLDRVKLMTCLIDYPHRKTAMKAYRESTKFVLPPEVKPFRKLLADVLCSLDPENPPDSTVIYQQVCSDLGRLFESGLGWDFIVSVPSESNPNQLVDLKCHKAILRAQCPYFQLLLNSSMREVQSGALKWFV